MQFVRSRQSIRMSSVLAQLEERKKVSEGGTIVLDGGMGTLITERVDIKDPWWGNVGFAQLVHPDVVEECHRIYLQSGCDVLITNTYACSRNVLYTALKHGKFAFDCNKLAGDESGADPLTSDIMSVVVQRASEASVDVARRAAQTVDRPILIAGSVGSHTVCTEEGDMIYPAEPGRELKNYEQCCANLIDAGVDVIFLEMISDLVHGPVAVEAVANVTKTKPCPVFLGISTILQANGDLVLEESTRTSHVTEELLKSWIGIFDSRDVPLAGINIMHTPFDAVLATINLVKKVWSGRIGCYPDCGVYSDDCVYESLDIAPESVRAYADEWRRAGVSMVGGCCGVGPELVTTISDNFNRK